MMRFLSSLVSLLSCGSLASFAVAQPQTSQESLAPTRFKLERRSSSISPASPSSSIAGLNSSTVAFSSPRSSLSPSPSSSSSSSMSSTGSPPSQSEATTVNSTTPVATSSAVVTIDPPSTSVLSSANATTTSSFEILPTPSASLPPNATNANTTQVVTVLQLAFVLETLEFEFYKAALKKFGIQDFVRVGFSAEQAAIMLEELRLVVANEENHVSVIEETILALGAQPFQGCALSLESALVDPLAFIATARTLEIVGISAYAGATHLVSDPQILIAIATILPIEARHSALLNTLSVGTLAPQSFEIALDVPSVLALVGGFLIDCTPADLGLVANQPLGVVEAQFASTFFTIGSRLVFTVSIEVDINVLFCQIIVGGAPAALVLPGPACAIPQGIDGPVAVYLTNSSTPLASNILVQATVQIVAGPAIIFVDARATLLASLFERPQIVAPMYSADFGGYWVERRKGKGEPKLVKTGSRHGPSTAGLGNNPTPPMRFVNEPVSARKSRARSVPDALLADQGVYRPAEGWVSD
ncbi:hypothetical protein JCM3766R1_002114 [Sporobolomyces carnicolor]